MTTQVNMMGAALAPVTAQAILGTVSPQLAVTAAGASQGTATLLVSDFTVCTTVAAATGVRFPSVGVTTGDEWIVANNGANSLSVYPATGGVIGTAAANAAVALAAGKTGIYKAVSSLNWVSIGA